MFQSTRGVVFGNGITMAIFHFIRGKGNLLLKIAVNSPVAKALYSSEPGFVG